MQLLSANFSLSFHKKKSDLSEILKKWKKGETEREKKRNHGSTNGVDFGENLHSFVRVAMLLTLTDLETLFSLPFFILDLGSTKFFSFSWETSIKPAVFCLFITSYCSFGSPLRAGYNHNFWPGH